MNLATTAPQGLLSRLVNLLPPLLVLAAAMLGAPRADAAGVQGSGKVITDTRTIGEFDAIAISGAMNLSVRQGSKEALSVTADDNIVPLIETFVEGKTLQVRMKKGEWVSGKATIKVQVEVAKLQGVSSSGAGDIQIDGLKTPLLKLSIAGSGDAKLNALTTDALEVRVAGSGDVRGNGSAKMVKLSIAGSGDVALTDLIADDVTVSIAGSGDAQVTANKSLSATVAGSGDVKYSGNATAIKTSVMGSGKISKR